MIRFIIRCALALAAIIFTVILFKNGNWGWGIVMIPVIVIVGLTFFRNENMILAMNQMGQAGAMRHVIPVVIAQAIFGYEDDHHCQS